MTPLPDAPLDDMRDADAEHWCVCPECGYVSRAWAHEDATHAEMLCDTHGWIAAAVIVRPTCALCRCRADDAIEGTAYCAAHLSAEERAREERADATAE